MEIPFTGPLHKNMAQEKGKNLDQLETQLTLKNHNPGCMWGILHHFQHNRWNNAVRKLPHKRLIGHGKHSTDQGKSKTKSISSTSAHDAAKVEENAEVSAVESPLVETKADVPGSSSHKSSMKSRIKALIIDDKRRKGRYKRSCTYPARKSVDGPTQQTQEKLESPHPPSSPRTSNDEPCSSSSCPRDHSVGPTTAKTSEESNNDVVSCGEVCDTMLKVNYLKQNELGKQPIRDHTLLHGNSIYAVEPSKRDAIQESKLFMDALDLLNVREEVFLKILQDPKSSLANNQLQFRQSPNLRFGLNKCFSFAVTEKREFAGSEKSKQLEEDEQCCEYDENGGEEKGEESAKKNGDNNKTGIKGFKSIGARIKYVIRDKKKEKNRIIKDAVHDKIPCDRSPKNDGQIGTDFGQSSKKSFKRTTSFNDSFDRYNQLLEISINRDAKDHISDRLRFKAGDGGTDAHFRKSPAKLGRIFSLPDLRSYSSNEIDNSASNSPRVALNSTTMDEINEQNLVDRSYSSTQIEDSTSNSPLVALDTTAMNEINEQKPVDRAQVDDSTSNSPLVASYSTSNSPTQIDDSTSNSSRFVLDTAAINEINEQKPVDRSYSSTQIDDFTSDRPLFALDTAAINEVDGQKPVDSLYSSTRIDDFTSTSHLVAPDTTAINEKKPAMNEIDGQKPVDRSYSSTQIEDFTSDRPLVALDTAAINELDGQKPVDSLYSSTQIDDSTSTSHLVAPDTAAINEKEPAMNEIDGQKLVDGLYSSTRIDDFTSNSPRVASDTDAINEINEQKPVDLGLDSENQENFIDVGDYFDELVILKKSESDSPILNIEHVLVSAPHSPDLDEISEDCEFVHEIEVCEDSNSPTIQQNLSFSEQDMIDIITQESEIQQFYDDLMHTHKVDTKNLAEYNYVRDVLELSGFCRDACLGKWQSSEHLLNPSVFEQVEGCLVDQSECEQIYANNDHALLFDMINEVLLGMHERSFCYWPRALTSLSRMHRLPKENRILEEVWAEIRWLLSWRPECDQAIDDAVSRDMERDDGWMNLQLDAECVGLKLEAMIFDDLVDEIIEERGISW